METIRAADLPQVSIRAPEPEIEEWKAAAKADGRSLTQWLRFAANRLARQQERKAA